MPLLGIADCLVVLSPELRAHAEAHPTRHCRLCAKSLRRRELRVPVRVSTWCSA
jgi:hypothetical protein